MEPDVQERMAAWFLVQDRLAEFGRAVDAKQFHRLEQVMTPDVVGIYNGQRSHETCAQLIDAMEINLGVDSYCAKCQHNVLNVQVFLDGKDHIESLANFYAIQQGQYDYEGQYWKTWGEYNDFWVRTPGGLRLRERRYTTFFSEGPAEIVTPRKR